MTGSGSNLPDVIPPPKPSDPVRGLSVPELIEREGPPAMYAWGEFLVAQIRNVHTRAAYRRSVERFLKWLRPSGLMLTEVQPAHLGNYLDSLPLSIPSKKLELAALRRFFALLVTRHVVVLNPAASGRGERYEVVESKTPEITPGQARQLLKSIDGIRQVDLRDRAIIAVLIYTAARASAVARLQVKHLVLDGDRQAIRFHEKGGKSRLIPVRSDLQYMLADYSDAARETNWRPEAPLFRSIDCRTRKLSVRGLTGGDTCRIVKRRLKDAGLPARLSPHSFRVLTVTDLLGQGVALEDVHYLAGHADPRTTRLYDRRPKRVTQNLVERISV